MNNPTTDALISFINFRLILSERVLQEFQSPFLSKETMEETLGDGKEFKWGGSSEIVFFLLIPLDLWVKWRGVEA